MNWTLFLHICVSCTLAYGQSTTKSKDLFDYSVPKLKDGDECVEAIKESEFLPPAYIVLLALVLFVGVFFRRLSAIIRIPYTVAMFFLGLGLGFWHSYCDDCRDYIGTNLAFMEPETLLFIFLPVLIFESAFSMDTYVFKKVAGHSILLAGPGLLFATFATAGVAMLCYSNWTLVEALLFGAVISATDPVAVVALLKTLGADKHVASLIEGESLLNDGVAIVLYNLLKSAVHCHAWLAPGRIVLTFSLVALGGPLFGLLMGIIFGLAIKRTWQDPTAEIALTLTGAYLTHYIAEGFLKVSGVLALVAFGLWLSAHSSYVSPEASHLVHEFWELIAWFANTVIFVLIGIEVASEYGQAGIDGGDYLIVLILYGTINVVRFAMIGLFFFPLKMFKWKLDWKNAILCGWGGLRGAVGLALALGMKLQVAEYYEYYKKKELGELETGEEAPQWTGLRPEYVEKVAFHVSAVVVLTLVVNGVSTRYLVKALKLAQPTVARKLLLKRLMSEIKLSIQHSIRVAQTDPHVADAHWREVGVLTTIKDPHKTKSRRCCGARRLKPAAKTVLTPVGGANPNMYGMRLTGGTGDDKGVPNSIVELSNLDGDPTLEFDNDEYDYEWNADGTMTVAEGEHHNPSDLIGQYAMNMMPMHGVHDYYGYDDVGWDDNHTRRPSYHNNDAIERARVCMLVAFKQSVLHRYHKGLTLSHSVRRLNELADEIINRPGEFFDTMSYGSKKRNRNKHWAEKLMSTSFKLNDFEPRESVRIKHAYDMGISFLASIDLTTPKISSFSSDKMVTSTLRKRSEYAIQIVNSKLQEISRVYGGALLTVKTKIASRLALNEARSVAQHAVEEGLIDPADGERVLEEIAVRMKRTARTAGKMGPPRPHDVIVSAPWWKELTPSLQQFLLNNSSQAMFMDGQTLTQLGEGVAGLAMVLEGIVSIREEEYLNYLGPGRTFNIMAVLTGTRSPVEITAHSAGSYLLFDLPAVHQVLRASPKLTHHLWRTIGIRVASNLLAKELPYSTWPSQTFKAHMENALLHSYHGGEEVALWQKYDYVIIAGSASSVSTGTVWQAPLILPSHSEVDINNPDFQETMHVMRSAFDRIDVDGDGYLTEEEFQQALLEFGRVYRQADMKRLIKDLDRNEDGQLQFEEFLSLVTKMTVVFSEGAQCVQIHKHQADERRMHDEAEREANELSEGGVGSTVPYAESDVVTSGMNALSYGTMGGGSTTMGMGGGRGGRIPRGGRGMGLPRPATPPQMMTSPSMYDSYHHPAFFDDEGAFDMAGGM